MAFPLLVSCKWLNCQLEKQSIADLVILDVSWSSSKDMEEEYKKGHIPGSKYLNVMNGENTDLFPRNIPTAEKFQDCVRSVGINNTSHIVLYSNSDYCGYFLSGRAWWTFKYFGAENVAILDGGWQKWNKEGYLTITDIPSIKTGDFTAKIQQHLKRQFEDMETDVKSHKGQICDSRATSKYSGPDGGHIAGAKSLPLDRLIDAESSTLKPTDEIKKEFSAAGIDITKPLTTYCNSGMSSCSLLFAANLCENTNASLFHGGFTQWSKTVDKNMIENDVRTDPQ